MKKVLLFALGVFVGATVILNELIQERVIVNNNLDGSVTIHHPWATLNSPSKAEKVN